jgi:hypothetical protein
VPTLISGLLLVMFAPMIFRLSNSYFEGITGFSENVYLWNWLLVSAILFGASGVVFLVRLGRSPRREFHTMCTHPYLLSGPLGCRPSGEGVKGPHPGTRE